MKKKRNKNRVSNKNSKKQHFPKWIIIFIVSIIVLVTIITFIISFFIANNYIDKNTLGQIGPFAYPNPTPPATMPIPPPVTNTNPTTPPATMPTPPKVRYCKDTFTLVDENGNTIDCKLNPENSIIENVVNKCKVPDYTGFYYWWMQQMFFTYDKISWVETTFTRKYGLCTTSSNNKLECVTLSMPGFIKNYCTDFGNNIKYTYLPGNNECYVAPAGDPLPKFKELCNGQCNSDKECIGGKCSKNSDLPGVCVAK